MMVDLLSDDQKISKWIGLDKLTYANLVENNEPLKFPKVDLIYENLPRSLTMIEDFDFNKSQTDKLHKANIYCIEI